jgi:hypothetical protein
MSLKGSPMKSLREGVGFYANSIIPNSVKKRAYGGEDKCPAAVN